MSKLLISFAALAALTVAAQAQTPTPPADAKPAAGDAAKPAGGDTANQETYKMKDGGMYQPPAQRPASPAQNLSVYGRT